MKAVLPFEANLAAKQSDIGFIHRPEFAYKLELRDLTPIQEKAIRYPPHVEDWLDGYLNDLLERGIITEVGPTEDVQMQTGLVLVPDAQSGQPYRVC